jgi:hypothetical protein
MELPQPVTQFGQTAYLLHYPESPRRNYPDLAVEFNLLLVLSTIF